jgi:uncharacterized protein YggT (Ycf19 family)
MAKPDISRNNDDQRPGASRRNRPDDYEEFHESLAAPAANRTYRSEVDLATDRASTAEQVVRFISTILGTLLTIRFLISLFTADRTNGLVNFFYATTDWMVRPFQLLFNQTPAGSGGFFDVPALVALAVLGFLTWLVLRTIRPRLD